MTTVEPDAPNFLSAIISRAAVLASSTVAATSQSEKTPDAPPEEASSGEGSSQEDPPESKGDAGDPEVGEGEWLSSSYFDDALFVGDSITEGIKLYDVMNNATVLASTGVNLDSLYTKNAITLADGSKVPILEASKNYSPGKIYLMMGVNSLLSDEESFRAAYGRVVDTLITQHPDAIVYIQSILPVTAAYEARPNAVADNAKIDRYNAIIKELAAKMPAGPIEVAVKGAPAEGAEASNVLEQPRGECYYYARGNGTKHLDRMRMRTPTSQNLAGMVEALKGCDLADVNMVILTIDPCISCTER